MLSQPDQGEDLAEVIRGVGDAHLLFLFLALGNQVDDDGDPGAVDVVLVAEGQQDLLIALNRSLLISLLDRLVGE